ncbi:Narbonolide/10-deoxymethynolide synthase PikA1, modules 1 and 2 [Streptomyces microflavus]
MADRTTTRTYDRHEPVAIVGIGCRLPALIQDPTALWQALLTGVDAVRQVPANRWNATAWADAEASGGAANRRGGFLDDVTGFDAEYFGIPPAEARQMDPQQRIALEVACAAASHSPHMEVLLPALREQLTGLAPADPEIAFYSSVTGERAAGPELDADYWCRNLREPVRFDRALERLRADGFGTFVEVSPHPVLQIALAQGTEADGAAIVVGGLRRGHGGIEQPLRALAELHTQGVPIPWQRVFAASDTRRVDLPTYAFEHRSYWLDEHDDAIPAGSGASWREDVMALPEPERLGSLVALVTEEAAALLGRPVDGVRPDLTLREQGFDSLMVVELRNRLSARTLIPLPTVLAFDYPTPQAIATLLLTHAGAQYAQDEAPEVPPAVAAVSRPPDDDDPVVIVSMACRLPDGIDTPEAFWDLLVDGREASSPFPRRWDGWDLGTIEEAERAATGRRFERKGGFVSRRRGLRRRVLRAQPA